jgi:anthranilate/para-aminobenzoate synthase component I
VCAGGVLNAGPVQRRRFLPVLPDALAIARALADRPGLAVLASRPAGAPRPGDALRTFVACDPIDASDDLVPPPPPGAEPGDAPAWIGVVPYEALRAGERPEWTRHPDARPPCAVSRPAWRRYPAVVEVDHATGRVAVCGDDDRDVENLARLVAPGAARGGRGSWDLQTECDEPDAAHLERVAAALELIAAGDLYEVNLARRIRLTLRGDALALFTRVLEVAPAPWGFFQDLGESLVIATSPELALSVDGDRLRTCPIKGTRPRGGDAAQDARLAAELDADPKERAELTMAVDVHRNDLGRVAVPGSVRVLGEPALLAGRTVWSRASEIVARRAAGASLADVARAVLPCGSVTGAPKVRAMEVIARLEPHRRGVYTGAFGYVGGGERLELAMAIRTMELSRDRAPASGVSGAPSWTGAYFAGGGIVADSAPQRELEETRWKAAQLARLGGAG